ncbi:MAG: carboxymuconolactone decarboxylase family protein [Nitrososphaerota archaeon]|nr:carboxymuconolactone decarboxylase family protein [Nitrososphaerota archaeon]
MGCKEKDEKVRRLLERMKEKRGYVVPEWEFLIKKDPEFFEAYENLYDKSLMDGKALPAKVRELIAIAILAFRGQREAVLSHVKRALALGATKDEILEAIETAMVPGGAPTLAIGLYALKKIEEEGG